MLTKMRKVCSKNPILGYLNINSLANKVISLRDVCAKVPIEIKQNWMIVSQINSFSLKIISFQFFVGVESLKGVVKLVM